MNEVTIDIIDNGYNYFNVEAASSLARDFVDSYDSQAYDQFLTQFMAEPMIDEQTISTLLEQNIEVNAIDFALEMNSPAPFIDFSAADIGSANDYNFN
jgi:hypothetical protein